MLGMLVMTARLGGRSYWYLRLFALVSFVIRELVSIMRRAIPAQDFSQQSCAVPKARQYDNMKGEPHLLPNLA